MRTMTKILAGGAGFAALAAAAPAAAQYAYPYGYSYNPYAYSNAYSPYNNAYMTQNAASRCSAAVQARLNSRVNLGSILGSLVGLPTTSTGRVLSVTQVVPRRSTVRVRGLASSGRFAGYGPYGVGAYGAYGYGMQPDLSFACTVDYNGYIRDIDINRR